MNWILTPFMTEEGDLDYHTFTTLEDKKYIRIWDNVVRSVFKRLLYYVSVFSKQCFQTWDISPAVQRS